MYHSVQSIRGCELRSRKSSMVVHGGISISLQVLQRRQLQTAYMSAVQSACAWCCRSWQLIFGQKINQLFVFALLWPCRCWLVPRYRSLQYSFYLSSVKKNLETANLDWQIMTNFHWPITVQSTRGVQKVLQLDHKEEWKCYKLHFIFQYNHHWVQRICNIFLADCEFH